MKKNLLLLFSVLFLSYNTNAQDQKKAFPLIAVFQGNQAALDKEIASKTIAFTLKNLTTHSRNDFENKAKKYDSFFTIYYPETRENNTSQTYILTLSGKTEIKMLNRLFISAGINQVEFNGKTMEREEFFKPYMPDHQ